jgi:hypothetical protein
MRRASHVTRDAAGGGPDDRRAIVAAIPVPKSRSSAPYPLFDRACTIFCRAMKPDGVVEHVSSIVPNLRVRVRGGAKTWNAITLHHATATLVLTKTKFEGPGFKGRAGTFNRVTLGAGTYFRRVRVRPAAIREQLLAQISATELLIGCVASPAFSVELGHYSVVFAIARALSGLIFDGQGMLDGDGKLVLAATGQHGIQVWRPAVRHAPRS